MKTIDKIVESSNEKLKSQALSRDDLMQHIQDEVLGEHPGYRSYSDYLKNVESQVLQTINPAITMGFNTVYYSVNGSKLTPEQAADINMLERFNAHVQTYLEQEIYDLKVSEQDFRDLVFDFVINTYSSQPISSRMHHAEATYEKYAEVFVEK